MSACRSCGATVRWVKTTAGKTMPMDPEPRDDGNIELTGMTAETRQGTEVPVVRYAAGDQLALEGVTVDRFVSHFTTCPQADEWRQRDPVPGPV